MDSFFSPKSIAVVGASATAEKTGHQILKNIIEGGFKGDIYPINLHEKNILKKKTYPSLINIGKKVDLVVIVIPAPSVAKVVEEGAKLGTKHFVIISAGFSEIGGKGKKLEKALETIVKKNKLHIMGPNCLGVLAPGAKLNAAFGGPMPPAGNVSLISQSGAIISSLYDWAGPRNFGFSKIVSLGNTLQLDENECLKYLEKDPETKVIVLFLKHFKDKEAFLKLCKRISKKKAIILYKSGEHGVKKKRLQTELIHAGVLYVESIEHLYDLTHCCSVLPVPKGDTVCVVTNAGGPATIAKDAIRDSKAIRFSSCNPAVQKELAKILPPEALPANPLDLIGDAQADVYEKSLKIILKNKATHALIVILSPQAMTEEMESAKAIIAVKKKYPEIPLITCFMGGTSVQESTQLLLKNHIPCFLDPLDAVWTVEQLNFLRQSRS